MILLSLTDPDLLSKNKITEYETGFLKNCFRETTSTAHFERTRCNVFIRSTTRINIINYPHNCKYNRAYL